MERHAFARIGRRPVSEVNTADVLEILTAVWRVMAETPHGDGPCCSAFVSWSFWIW